MISAAVSCTSPDDTAATIKKRLEVYFAETAPLIDYYSREDKLVEIDGVGSVDKVAQRILAVLQAKEFATR